MANDTVDEFSAMDPRASIQAARTFALLLVVHAPEALDELYMSEFNAGDDLPQSPFEIAVGQAIMRFIEDARDEAHHPEPELEQLIDPDDLPQALAKLRRDLAMKKRGLRVVK